MEDESTEEKVGLPAVGEENADDDASPTEAKSSEAKPIEAPALSPREARKKELEEKKKKILEDRAKARQEKAGLPVVTDELGEGAEKTADSTDTGVKKQSQN